MIMRKNGHIIEKPRTMFTSKLMAVAWQDMLDFVGSDGTKLIPSEVHPDDLKTYKRLFYAGGRELFRLLMASDALEETDELKPDDAQRFLAVMHELDLFFVEVAAGRQ
jgi:hypothetical protein